MLSSEGRKFKFFLRRKLKVAEKSQLDLAKFLGVSHPTANRILNDEDIPLERLIKIASFFKMSVDELFAEFSEFDGEPDFLSKKQEQFFVQKPLMLYFFILLNTRSSFKEVIKSAEMTEKDGKLALFELEKMGFVEIQKGTRFKLKVTIPLLRSPDPESVFTRKLLSQYIERFFIHARNMGRGISEDGLSYFAPFGMYLSPSSMKKFTEEQQELLRKYQRISNIESKSAKYPEIQPYAGMLALKNVDIWREVCL